MVALLSHGLCMAPGANAHSCIVQKRRGCLEKGLIAGDKGSESPVDD